MQTIITFHPDVSFEENQTDLMLVNPISKNGDKLKKKNQFSTINMEGSSNKCSSQSFKIGLRPVNIETWRMKKKNFQWYITIIYIFHLYYLISLIIKELLCTCLSAQSLPCFLNPFLLTLLSALSTVPHLPPIQLTFRSSSSFPPCTQGKLFSTISLPTYRTFKLIQAQICWLLPDFAF